MKTITRRRFVTMMAALGAITLGGCSNKDTQLALTDSEASNANIRNLESIQSNSGIEATSIQDEQTLITLPSSFDITNGKAMLNNGITIPTNGLGTYSLNGATCIDSVTTALKSGVRLIDTAYMYGNEAEVGQAIRESDIPREDIFVITKLYPSQFSNAPQAIEEALDKMDIEYIDMVLLHHPGFAQVEAYRAMEDALRNGHLRSIGLSCFYEKELSEFLSQITVMPALVQNEMHPYYQDTNVVEFIHQLGIATQAWYPLGGRGHNDELLNDPILESIASAHKVSIPQVILRWNLQRGVIVIPGSSNPSHINEDTNIYGFELSQTEMESIAALNRDEKHDWY